MLVLLFMIVIVICILAHNGRRETDPVDILDSIHARLCFDGGSLDDEYEEQFMIVRFVRPFDRVLELGGNIGRSSCVIASVLSDSSNLVVFEPDPKTAQALRHNRDMNGFQFHIETRALSKRPLMQAGWTTQPAPINSVPPGWKRVATVAWPQVLDTHKRFDTLVCDCEGALYQIVKDEPGFLKNFKTVIIENDFKEIQHKRHVDAELQEAGMRCVYRKAGGFGPCTDMFYETWQRAD